MSSKLFIQMGTEIDPSKVKASMGGEIGEIDNRSKDGTEIFDSAYRVRDYVCENRSRISDHQEFSNDAMIKEPQSDRPIGAIIWLNRKLPAPLRGLTNAMANIISSVVSGISRVFRGTVGALFGGAGSEGPRVRAENPLEGGLSITPAEGGFEVEAIEEGETVKAYFSSDTRPGELCESVMKGANAQFGAAKQETVDSPEMNMEAEVSIPTPAEVAAEEMETGYDEAEVPDHILEQYADGIDESAAMRETMDSNNAPFEFENEGISNDDELESPPLQEVNASALESTNDLTTEAVIESAPSYILPDVLQNNDVINLSEEDVQIKTENLGLTMTPSLGDAFRLEMGDEQEVLQLDVKKLEALCASEEPELAETYEVDRIFQDGDTDGTIQFKSGTDYMVAGLNDPEKRVLFSLSGTHNVQVKGEEVAKLDGEQLNSCLIGGVEYSVPQLIQEVGEQINDPKLEIPQEILDRCSIEPTISQQADLQGVVADYLEPEVEVSEELPESLEPERTVEKLEQDKELTAKAKSGLSDIFYKHKVPGDPKSMDI